MGNRQKQSGQTDYLLLLIVIIVGVTVGNLLSNWITARVALYQTEQALIEFNEQLSTQISTDTTRRQTQRLASNRASTEKTRKQELQIRQQRANTRIGQFLAKSCEEWKATDQRYASRTSQLEMEKACQQYDDYLNTGMVPSGGFR